MKRSAIALFLVSAACSSNPEPAPTPTPTATATPAATQTPTATTTPVPNRPGAFDPVGAFDVRIDGEDGTGTVTITRGSDGKLGGSVADPNGQTMAARSVTQEGQKVTMLIDIPGGPTVTFVMNFESSDKFAGTINAMTMNANVTGTRKKS